MAKRSAAMPGGGFENIPTSDISGLAVALSKAGSKGHRTLGDTEKKGTFMQSRTNRFSNGRTSHPLLPVAAMTVALLFTSVSTARAGIAVGACCVNGICQDNGGVGIDSDTCTITLGGLFQGDGTTCATATCSSVPAVSQWGMVVMVLLTLTAAAVVLRRRKTGRFHAAIGYGPVSCDGGVRSRTSSGGVTQKRDTKRPRSPTNKRA